MSDDVQAVLIIGTYLSGKSSVAAEVADVLERNGDPFALLDLDYLGWASAPGYDGHGDDPWLLLRNLRAVAGNDVAAGSGGSSWPGTSRTASPGTGSSPCSTCR